MSIASGRLPAADVRSMFDGVARRYDVTNTVQVSSTDAVRRAVCELFRQNWPHYPFDRVESAFSDFERLFNGQFPGYYGCDTVYHDLQSDAWFEQRG